MILATNNNHWISIHALRGEGDRIRATSQRQRIHFNPRPPWGGRRWFCACSLGASVAFQSTPSVGRATLKEALTPTDIFISIHALRGEGDRIYGGIHSATSEFQSTPSVGRATFYACEFFRVAVHFNPRPPWGGRRELIYLLYHPLHFNPRPPWGGRRQKYTNIQYCVCT